TPPNWIQAAPAPARSRPRAGSPRPCSPQARSEARPARPGSAGTPSPDSPAPAATPARAHHTMSPDDQTTMRIAPAARHELAVPAQKRRRRDEERSPSSPRQHTADRGEHHPIARAKLRTRALTLQNHQLVAQDEDLELLRPLRPRAQDEQLEQ